MHRYVSVLVVVVIALIGIGLLVPAIGKVREASRRMTCKRNLEQVGDGLQGYPGVLGYFPPATVPNVLLAPSQRLSWLVEVQPHVPIQITVLTNREQPWDAPENYNLKGKGTSDPPFPMPNFMVFMCPSAPVWDKPDGPGPTHYVGVAGLGEKAAELPLGYPEAGLFEKGVGVFGYDRSLKLSDIKDGTANTVAVAETGWKNGPWTAGGHSTVRGLIPGGPYVGAGRQFGGVHPGCAMTLFADGSVRGIDNSVSPEVFEALATIAGGEE